MFHGGPSGCTFEGTNGKLYIERGILKSEPESIVKEPLGAWPGLVLLAAIAAWLARTAAKLA